MFVLGDGEVASVARASQEDADERQRAVGVDESGRARGAANHGRLHGRDERVEGCREDALPEHPASQHRKLSDALVEPEPGLIAVVDDGQGMASGFVFQGSFLVAWACRPCQSRWKLEQR